MSGSKTGHMAIRMTNDPCEQNHYGKNTIRIGKITMRIFEEKLWSDFSLNWVISLTNHSNITLNVLWLLLYYLI